MPAKNQLLGGGWLVLAFLLAAAPASARDLEIVGSGACEGVVTRLAQAFMQSHQDDLVTVPPETGSTRGIRDVGEGKAILARVSRRLRPEEKERFQLAYEPFGSTAIVFATHSGITLETLSRTQLLDLVSGTVSMWDQVGGGNGHTHIRLFVRQPSDEGFATITKAYPEVTSDIVSRKAKTVFHTSQMEKGLELRRGGFGWVTMDGYLAKRLAVNLVPIEGLLPNTQNPSADTYPLLLEYGFVYGPNLPEVAKDFLEFVKSARGAEVMKEVGVGSFFH